MILKAVTAWTVAVIALSTASLSSAEPAPVRRRSS